jgi:hypothetical protein
MSEESPQDKFSSYRIISDPEGFSIEQLANIKTDKDSNEIIDLDTKTVFTDKLIILGDLLDSTCGTYQNLNKPPSNELMQQFGKPMENRKAFNLRNLQWIKNNDSKIEAVLIGNRDLNKLKCIPLLEFRETEKVKQIKQTDTGEETTEEEPDWWNNGKTYMKVAENLVETLQDDKDGKKWLVDDANFKKMWYPWWNRRILSEKPTINNPWNPTVDSDDHCLRRFQLIFGADGAVGTMSADNLLETIPMELLQTKKEKTNEYTNLTDDEYNSLIDVEYNSLDENMKAALVLIVFRRLLLPPVNGPISDNFPFDGLLYDYFDNKKVKVCHSIDNGNDLAIFSHGGMTHKFFDTKDLLTDYENLLFTFLSVTERIKKFNQDGGFYRTTTNIPVEKSIITTKIDDFNKNVKTKITEVLEIQSPADAKPTINDLLLILLGVPLLPHDQEQPKLNPDQVGPIQPGIIKFRDNTDQHFTMDKGDLYQFIGHAPLGYAPTVDLYDNENENGKHFFINVDISNSLLGHIDLTEVKEHNYCYVTYDLENNVKFKEYIILKKTENNTKKLREHRNNNALDMSFSPIKGGVLNELEQFKQYKDYSIHELTNNDYLITEKVTGFPKFEVILLDESLEPEPEQPATQEGGKRKKRRSMKKKRTQKKKKKVSRRKTSGKRLRYSKKKN